MVDGEKRVYPNIHRVALIQADREKPYPHRLIRHITRLNVSEEDLGVYRTTQLRVCLGRLQES